MIQSYLEQIGFNDKEQKIYLTLSEIGIQPASVVARKCNLDRVTTYKNLKKLVHRGFVKAYYRDNIQCFGIENFENLQGFIKDKIHFFQDLQEKFPVMEKLLVSLKGEESLIPKLQMFEGEAGIKSFFRDLLHEIKSEGLHQIRMLTSNTFDERLGDVSLSKFVHEFFQEIQ